MTAVEPATERQPQSAAAPSPFPPIAEYAFLSNCHTGALVAPDGAIDWLCVPRFDSPSVFGSLLDREDTITPHTRPPADDDADHILIRTVECLEGEVEVELVCEPAFDYGREPAEWALIGDDRHAADATGAGMTIRLQTNLGLGIEENRIRARHVLKAGDRAYCSLSWDEGLVSPEDVEDAYSRIAATTRFWRAWLGRARIPDHRFRDPVQRSALTIKGLSYMPTGATVAALATSLPETPGGERNWDYRYTWIRDTTFTLQALHMLNLDWEAD